MDTRRDGTDPHDLPEATWCTWDLTSALLLRRRLPPSRPYRKRSEEDLKTPGTVTSPLVSESLRPPQTSTPPPSPDEVTHPRGPQTPYESLGTSGRGKEVSGSCTSDGKRLWGGILGVSETEGVPGLLSSQSGFAVRPSAEAGSGREAPGRGTHG